MSFGFTSCVEEVRVVLKKAQENRILIFAAMSNHGIYKDAAWPARTAEDAIGIHSCNELGKTSSDFTPRHVTDNRNFMVVGEGIRAHQLTAKGGGYMSVEGTSFATPVAVSMAALILSFADQWNSQDIRKEYVDNGLDPTKLNSTWGMRNILREISKRSGKYSWIDPQLLWIGYLSMKDEPQGMREQGWRVIWSALCQGP
jgi:subtilisin family serine protease